MSGNTDNPFVSDRSPFTSFAFGLTIAANVAVPGLASVPATGTPDLRITLACMPDIPPDWLDLHLYSNADSHREPNLQVFRHASGSHYRLRYLDGTEFVLTADGSDLWATWAPTATIEDTATYLLGPVLGLALRLRGTTSLHASAAEIRGKLAVFTGPAGAGKSSVCAALAMRGSPVTGDDVLPLGLRDGVFTACAAYARVRLWPDTAAALFGYADALPRLTPTWDKRFLPVDQDGRTLVEGHVPIGCIYVMANKNAEEHATYHRLSARDALLALVANTYANYLLTTELRAAEFRLLSSLVSRVPVFSISIPRGLHLLASVPDQIIDHFSGALT